LNDGLTRAYPTADIPDAKEPAGLFHADSKHPDGTPWRAGKPIVWDVTVVCTCADSFVEASAREAALHQS